MAVEILSVPSESLLRQNIVDTIPFFQCFHEKRRQFQGLSIEEPQASHIKSLRVKTLRTSSDSFEELQMEACTKKKLLLYGKRVHAHMINTGLKPGISIGNCLLEMYAKCGSVCDARQVFEELPSRDVFSWNIMITGYLKSGNAIDARQLFDKMPNQSEISWNVMVAGYVRRGDGKEALNVFWQMQRSGNKPTQFTLASVLNTCAGLADLEQGKRVHSCIIKNRYELNYFVDNALIDMYAKCGSIEYACQVFDKMAERDVVSWNSIISGCARHLMNEKTLRLFWQMQQYGVKPNQFTYASVLTACASLPSLERGKQAHADIIRRGLESNVFAGSALVNMYAKCGSVEDARKVFASISERDHVSWTAMISAYAQEGLGGEALKLFSQMQELGIEPDQVTFVSVLTACVTSGRLEDARHVFGKMPERNVVSWNAMISGYSQNEHGEEALKLFLQMQRSGAKPTQSTLASVLSACAGLAALEQGNQVHAKIIRAGYELNMFVGSALVNMYAKCGSIADAQELFDTIPERNVVAWNAMIAGYAQNGYSEEALNLFCQMQQSGISYDQVTYPSILSACASLEDLGHGRQVHGGTIVSGFQSNVFVKNALIDMYSKCGSIKDACQLFQRMHERDVVSWNAMIVGYAQNGHREEVLKLFCQMLCSSIKPDKVSFASVLSACASLAALERGKQVHAYIMKTGFELNAFVGSALIDMYAKCGCMEDAAGVLDILPEPNVVSWNAITAGCVQNGNVKEAVSMFCQMQQTGMKVTQFTFASILVACGSLSSLDQGKQFHAHVLKTGFESNVFVGSALVDMYAKCESIVDAYQLFYEMPERNKVTWTAIIGGCAQNGHCEEVLKLFWQMKREDVKPDEATFSSVLRACATLATLQHGQQVHGHIIQTAFELNVYAGSSLVDMYAKCGAIEDACKVFNGMPEKDVVSWNAMISGHAQNGCSKNALQLFEEMLQACMKPDYITFIGVLSACGHAGLVEEGHHYFQSMIQDHCIQPRVEHYACMIDLLGRAGHFDEAKGLIGNMPFKPDAIMWGALLTACRIHSNKDLGKRAAKNLIEMEPQNSAPYVMLSNMYAAAGGWDNVTIVRKMMRDAGVKKMPGCSWIEIKNRIHAFTAEDRSHVQTEEIYAMLERLAEQMKVTGYMPDTNFALHDVKVEQKQCVL